MLKHYTTTNHPFYMDAHFRKNKLFFEIRQSWKFYNLKAVFLYNEDDLDEKS